MLERFPALGRLVRYLLDGVVELPPWVAAVFVAVIGLLVVLYYVRRDRDRPGGSGRGKPREVAARPGRAHS
jgi:hypothetical protein